jgi:aryl-alcohol dehydrogenase-like predicted oxidoreductase
MAACGISIARKMENHSVQVLQKLRFVGGNSLMSVTKEILGKKRNPYTYTLGINFKRPRIDIHATRKIQSFAIGRYIDAGMTAFDTADSYGYRNEIIGTFLRHRNREQFQIISKTFFPFPGQKPEIGVLSARNIESSINYSLKALKTDYLDILLAHRFDSNTNLVDTITTFDSEIQKGRILNWGFSEWPVEEISKALEICRERNLKKPVMNQVQANLLWRVSNQRILPLCKKEEILVLAWSPLAQGVSVGSYLEVGNYYPASRMAKNKTPFLRYFENQELFNLLSRFKSKHCLTSAEMADLSYFWLLKIEGFDGIVLNPNQHAISRQRNLDYSLSNELALISKRFAITSETFVGRDSPND